MPPDFPSDAAKGMRIELSSKFALKSRLYFERGRFPESFDQCAGGYDMSQSNPEVLDCLSKLQDIADQRVKEGCDGAKVALRITRENTLSHKNAEKVLEKCK